MCTSSLLHKSTRPIVRLEDTLHQRKSIIWLGRARMGQGEGGSFHDNNNDGDYNDSKVTRMGRSAFRHAAK